MRSLLLLVFFGFPQIVFGGEIKEIAADGSKAVLKLTRKEVRDLYESDIVPVRVANSDEVVEVAVVEKKGKDVLVAILPNQKLNRFLAGAEILFMKDNRLPSYLVWSKEAGDIQLLEEPMIGANINTVYYAQKEGGASHLNGFGYGPAVQGVYRSEHFGGVGIKYDTLTANLDYPEDEATGEFTQRRTKVMANVSISNAVSFGGLMEVQNQRETSEVTVDDEDYKASAKRNSTQYGATLGYRGYDYFFGVRFRNRGRLQQTLTIDDLNSTEITSIDLSSQYGVDFWGSNGRRSAYFLRLTYFKFENISGDYRPSLVERVNFSLGFENFVNPQNSIYIKLDKLPQSDPDQFGILRRTSTYNLGFGLTAIIAQTYRFGIGIDLGYGSDDQPASDTASGGEAKWSEQYAGLTLTLNYHLD